MHVVFIHGWSIRSTATYGELPLYLKAQAAAGKLDVTVNEVLLGKYVSFEDTVSIDDIARAFDAALRDHPALSIALAKGERFACITHSAGAPVVRQWMRRFHARNLGKCPFSHLIMIAPASHGSALAQLGKSTLARIKGHFDGIEPGKRVLDWLELGSEQSWTLNEEWLDYDLVGNGIFSFVLQGQSIDRKLYDVLNSYTDETGSDGVMRVAAANMNYALVSLRETDKGLRFDRVQRSPRTAFAILPGLAHSREEIGIIRSVTLANAASHPTTKAVLRCLKVKSTSAYAAVVKEFDALSAETQKDELTRRAKTGPFNRTFKTYPCSMLVFRILDDTGLPVTDYDLRFTAGKEYDDNALPPGFFIDRQRNQLNPGKLTYYLNHPVLMEGLNDRLDGRLGINITARPDEGLARYGTASFRGTRDDIVKTIRPNETVMIEIMLRRKVDRQVFTLTDKLDAPEAISGAPSGKLVRAPA